MIDDEPVRYGEVRNRPRYDGSPNRDGTPVQQLARRNADQSNGHAVADGEILPIDIERRLAGHEGANK